MKPDLFRKQPLSLSLPLDAIHDMMAGYAEESFDRRGSCPPTWLILSGENVLYWIESCWEDDQEKAVTTFFVGGLLRYFQAKSYAVALEAWASVYSIDEVSKDDLRNGRYTKPADQPSDKREDVCLISSVQRSGEHLLTRYLVNVRPPGKNNFLGPRVDNDFPGHMAGRMFNLFDDDRSERFDTLLAGAIRQMMKEFGR